MGTERTHDWRIEDREYLRQEQRRGRRHAYEHLDPARTGLVVIDMVPFFLADNPYCRAIVPNINRLAHALRPVGGLVAWVLPTVAEHPSPWATEFYGPDVAHLFNRSGGTGTPRQRLAPDLCPADADLFVEKSAASAFFPGKCPLPGMLEARAIDTVLVTGTVTNVCCESAARDAATLGYRVVMVADANATVSDDWHNATLRTIYRTFGDVRPVDDVIELLTTAR